MGLRIYAIMAEPGKAPRFYLTAPGGVLIAEVPAACMPLEVLSHAPWLSALADGHPLPPTETLPAVIRLSHPQGSFVGLVPVHQDDGP